jgi:hypothetical protein
MAQGMGKLSKSTKSKSDGATKKKVVRTKTVTKGRKSFKTKSLDATVIDNVATTKAINRKNEIGVAAKAVSVGTKFFLQDVADSGKQAHTKQIQIRDKKQLKSSSTASSANRLKSQLRKLGRDV